MFVDTNVLVYATQATAPQHVAAKGKLDSLHADGTVLYVSRQVLREYLAVVTRPQLLAAPLPITTALARIRLFAQLFTVLEDGPAVTVRLDELCRATRVGGRQIHDANIVATMLVHGETRLLTSNVQDFTRFNRWIEVLLP